MTYKTTHILISDARGSLNTHIKWISPTIQLQRCTATNKLTNALSRLRKGLPHNQIRQENPRWFVVFSACFLKITVVSEWDIIPPVGSVRHATYVWVFLHTIHAFAYSTQWNSFSIRQDRPEATQKILNLLQTIRVVT